MAINGKKVTLKEIAEKTGVSLGTVHRAIYGKAGVGDETRARILEEVKRSNYQIDEAASVMKRSVQNIAVVLPKVQNDDRFYFRAIWKGIREAAAGMEQYKLHYHFIESEFPFHQMARKLKEVYEAYADDMDGLITIGDNEEANRWIELFARKGIAVILVSTNYFPARERQSSLLIESIRVDHHRSGMLAGEMMRYGFKKSQGRVLIVDGESSLYGVRIQGQGLKDELEKFCPEIKTMIIPELNTAKAVELFEEALEKEDTLGVFCCNARNTYRACCLLDRSSRREDIIMIGSDVFEELIPFYENGTLNATVCQYHWEQGTRAVQKMYGHLSKGVQMSEDVMLPSVLVMRNNFRCFV